MCVCEAHACVCDTGTSIRIELVMQCQQHWFNQIQAATNSTYSLLHKCQCTAACLDTFDIEVYSVSVTCVCGVHLCVYVGGGGEGRR